VCHHPRGPTVGQVILADDLTKTGSFPDLKQPNRKKFGSAELWRICISLAGQRGLTGFETQPSGQLALVRRRGAGSHVSEREDVAAPIGRFVATNLAA
jgi:hypothetical protein